jgi:hypothetical protein
MFQALFRACSHGRVGDGDTRAATAAARAARRRKSRRKYFCKMVDIAKTRD